MHNPIIFLNPIVIKRSFSREENVVNESERLEIATRNFFFYLKKKTGFRIN